MNDVQAVRLLIGDQNAESFTDAEIQEFCDLAGVSGPGSEYFFAASIALNSLVSNVSANLTEVRIGDYMDSSGRNKAKALQDSSQRYLDLFYNTPAWAIVETDESDLNALIIIRNYVLRTNP